MLANIHDPIRLSGVDFLGDLPTLIAIEQEIFLRGQWARETAEKVIDEASNDRMARP